VEGTTFPAFLLLRNQVDRLFTIRHEQAQVRVQFWAGGRLATTSSQGSCWGFIQHGEAQLDTPQGTFLLRAGMYFASPDPLERSGTGEGLLVTQTEHQAFFMMGGPVEARGRLRYMDGCTDSLLIAPPLLGDPCLNLFHIPRHTFQHQHTHPSLRAGMIVAGSGQCITPAQSYPLVAGQAFVILPHAPHSFATETEELLVIAYHPDSDFGPTDEHHPMINRTYLK